jgi:hypothetical protein
MKSLPRIIFLLLAFLAYGQQCLAAANADEARPVPEYAMKAVYIYNFAQLSSWPDAKNTADNVFNLCIYGQDGIASALDGLRGKKVGSRLLRVLLVSDAAEARNCHLLYVGEGSGERGRRLFEALRGSPVLTITDDPRAERSGAMLLIVPDERRLAFEVNLEAARRSQLQFSSKLLHLARRVIGE